MFPVPPRSFGFAFDHLVTLHPHAPPIVPASQGPISPRRVLSPSSAAGTKGRHPGRIGSAANQALSVVLTPFNLLFNKVLRIGGPSSASGEAGSKHSHRRSSATHPSDDSGDTADGSALTDDEPTFVSQDTGFLQIYAQERDRAAEVSSDGAGGVGLDSLTRSTAGAAADPESSVRLSTLQTIALPWRVCVSITAVDMDQLMWCCRGLVRVCGCMCICADE